MEDSMDSQYEPPVVEAEAFEAEQGVIGHESVEAQKDDTVHERVHGDNPRARKWLKAQALQAQLDSITLTPGEEQELLREATLVADRFIADRKENFKKGRAAAEERGFKDDIMKSFFIEAKRIRLANPEREEQFLRDQQRLLDEQHEFTIWCTMDGLKEKLKMSKLQEQTRQATSEDEA